MNNLNKIYVFPNLILVWDYYLFGYFDHDSYRFNCDMMNKNSDWIKYWKINILKLSRWWEFDLMEPLEKTDIYDFKISVKGNFDTEQITVLKMKRGSESSLKSSATIYIFIFYFF